MDFSTQLRIILLIAGAVAMLCIYLLGKRHGRSAERSEQLSLRSGSPTVRDFGPVAELDEDELDTPAYLRRSQQEARYRDEPLPMVNLPAGALPDNEEDLDPEFSESVDEPTQSWRDEDEVWPTAPESKPVSESEFDEPPAEPQMEPTFAEQVPEESISVHVVEPNWQEIILADTATPEHEVPVVTHAESVVTDFESPTLPNITHGPNITHEPNITKPVEVPVVEQTVIVKEPPPRENALASSAAATAATPAEPAKAQSAIASPKPTAAGKRKIVALRLSMPVRVPGEHLLSLLQRENLQHGRFEIFHKLHEDVSVFSVASMVEPGSFNLSNMRDQQFPGVTLFMLLPGPLDGLVAWDQMYSCAQRLAHATQGVLQDERGHQLTSMAADRLREEVLDFQHLLGSVNV